MKQPWAPQGQPPVLQVSLILTFWSSAPDVYHCARDHLAECDLPKTSSEPLWDAVSGWKEVHHLGAPTWRTLTCSAHAPRYHG